MPLHHTARHTARGVYPIAPTPFDADGRVDVASIDRLTDFYRAVGGTGLTVLGVMGEAPKLEGAEALTVATRFIRRAGDLPVIVGVSAPGFAAMRALALASMEAGAAGAMIAPPHTLRTDDQLAGHYRHAVEAIGDIGSFVPFSTVPSANSTAAATRRTAPRPCSPASDTPVPPSSTTTPASPSSSAARLRASGRVPRIGQANRVAQMGTV